MSASESRRQGPRTTSDERHLIARQVLVDSDRFALDAMAMKAWDVLVARPARELPGLRRLMERSSPFVD